MTASRSLVSVELFERRALLSAYYVSTSGSDANPGSAASPWRTLQHAADSVVAGDTVTALPGDYAGFDLRTDGTPAQPITFRAQAARTVTIDRPNPRTAQDGINLEGASWITLLARQHFGFRPTT